MRAAPTLVLPERLGRFEVVEALGQSANAEFFGAFDPAVDRVVTLKTLPKSRVQSDPAAARTLARWRREATLGAALAHPGIVAIYDHGETAGDVYLALEFVQGHRLCTYFDRGIKFRAPDAASIAAQLLAALGHAHERGVRHGAISPASVWLTTRGEAKLGDFGRASAAANGSLEGAEAAAVPGYAAPEQYRGEPVDHRADLYALGALFFHLLTGRPAYRGSPEQIAYRVCRGSTPMPSDVDPRWERYDDVVRRALARSMDERFSSATEFRDAMVELEGGAVSATVSPEVLIHEPAHVIDLGEPEQADAARAGDDPDRPHHDAVESDASRALLEWHLALVAAVAVAAATIVMLADWSAPELRPRLARVAPDTTRPAEPPGAVTMTAPAPADERPSDRAPATAPLSWRDRDVATVARTDARDRKPDNAVTGPPASSVLAAPPERVPPVAELLPVRPPDGGTPARQAQAGTGPASLAPPSFWDDQAIAFKVATRLAFRGSLYRNPVRVRSIGGVVTLQGYVPSAAHAAEAIAVTRSVEGVRGVRSELRVGAPDYVFPGAISPP